jgi:hypothetical protein
MKKLNRACGARGITCHRAECLSSTCSRLRRECRRAPETRSIRWENLTIRMGKAELSRRKPQEIDALLRYNGFIVEHKFGGYDESPYGDDSPKQLIVSRR